MFGIYDIYRNSDLDYKTRVDIYKQAGFQELAIFIDNSYYPPHENYLDIITYARSIGLQVNQAHIDYKIANLICDNSTDVFFDYVSSKLQEAIDLKIPYVVTHVSNSDTPPQIDDVQLTKFKNIMAKFENENVTLCVENMRNNFNMDRILELQLPNIKVCFDLGHAHCYGGEYKLYEKYKDLIVCTHLHNNYGTDTHYMLSDGEIDYKYFVKALSQNDYVSNCLENFPREEKLSHAEFVKYVEDCYTSIMASLN